MSNPPPPIGAPVSGWTSRPAPPRTPIEGRFCRGEALDPPRHGQELFAANQLDREGRNWTYLSVGPLARFEDYRAWLDVPVWRRAEDRDPLIERFVAWRLKSLRAP